MAQHNDSAGERITGRPSAEELDMIREYIKYPHMIIMVQKSIEDLRNWHVTLKNILIRCQKYILFRINEDFRKLKQEMRRRGIRIEDKGMRDGTFYYHYYCRGYDDRFGIFREAMKTEIITKLTSYTNALGGIFKSKS